MNFLKSTVISTVLATSIGCSESPQNGGYNVTEKQTSAQNNKSIDPNSEEYINSLNIQVHTKAVSISPKTYEPDFVHSKRDLLTGRNLLQKPTYSLKEREDIISERMLNILRKHDLEGYPESITVMTDTDGAEFGKYIDIIPKNPRSTCTNAVRQMGEKYGVYNIPNDGFKYSMSLNEFTGSEEQRSVKTMRKIRNDAKKLITSGFCSTDDIQITNGERSYHTYPNRVVTYLVPNIEGVVIQDMQKLIETLKREGIAESGGISEEDILVRPSNIFYDPHKAIVIDSIGRPPDDTITAQRREIKK